jgi:hypothetical protein
MPQQKKKATSRRKKLPPPPTTDINSPAFAAWFRLAAEEFNRKYTRSKRAALALMVKEGILTKTGRLTANYR